MKDLLCSLEDDDDDGGGAGLFIKPPDLILFQRRVRLTFMTGVAGRVTVLTADAALLFAVTADEAGGMAAALTLLAAPLAPLAAPATQIRRSQTNRLGRLVQDEGGGGAHLPFLASMYLP